MAISASQAACSNICITAITLLSHTLQIFLSWMSRVAPSPSLERTDNRLDLGLCHYNDVMWLWTVLSTGIHLFPHRTSDDFE